MSSVGHLIPRHVLALFVALGISAIAGCSNETTKPLPPGDGILFIGNSLTYYNDMPEMVQSLADSTGVPANVHMVAFSNVALIDHWREGTARSSIAKGGWRYVVLQQGPSAVQYNRDSLRLLTKMFDDKVRAVGAKTALFSVWPMAVNIADFPRAIESYALAAADVDGVLLPVAAAWQETWKLDPEMALYAGDGLHPTMEGSYLAAIVIYAKLFDRSPIGLPASMTLRNGSIVAIAPTTASLLQQAALIAVSPTPTTRRTISRDAH